jgi:hypothetical protein
MKPHDVQGSANRNGAGASAKSSSSYHSLAQESLGLNNQDRGYRVVTRARLAIVIKIQPHELLDRVECTDLTAAHCLAMLVCITASRVARDYLWPKS